MQSPDAGPPEGGAHILVAVIDFNGLADTLACLESLEQQDCRQFSVMVIDNGSRTDSTPAIRARFPQYEVIRLDENLGWAGGNNLAMRAALERGASHVCLLNNDTVLEPGALGALLEADRRIGEPSLLHPAIAYFEDPTAWQLNPEHPRSTFPDTRGFDAASGIVEMDHAYGTCLLVPRAVLERIGLLDERFFLQLEETDFFRRAAAAGFRSFCARHARILHKESAAFGGRITPAKTYYQVRNTLLLTEKHAPGPRGFLRAGRSLLWMLHNQASNSGATIGGWGGFARWAVSRDPLAGAARQGVGHYLRRRFGRRPG